MTAYYEVLKQYGGLDVLHETALRSAMQNLLAEAGRAGGFTSSQCSIPSNPGLGSPSKGHALGRVEELLQKFISDTD